MASYADDHASYAQEQETRARDSEGHNRLDRNDPLLSSFFSGDRLESSQMPGLFSTLAHALQNHDPNSNSLMAQMIEQLLSEASSSEKPSGVGQEFLDTLDRVPNGDLKDDESCPICSTRYVEDQYPLVVMLRCRHIFDLECITPWLKLHTSCPMCRADVLTRKVEVSPDSEEEFDDTYG